MWTLPGALWVCGLVQSITCFSSTIIRVGAWIFLSCMIINHFSADWPIGEIALFENERSLVWSPWQPKHPVKTMCPFEVSLSRTPNLYPFIRSHCSLRESSRYKCQLNARTRSFKWSVSLCIGATVSAACMTIKHFLVELKDKFGRKTRKEEGDELWQRWRDGLSRKESKMMRPVGSQEVNGASVILLTSMLMKPMDQQSLVGWCVNVTQRTNIMVVVAKRRMTLQVICLHSYT